MTASICAPPSRRCNLPGPFLHAADSAKWDLLFVTADDMNADSSGWMGCKLPTTPNLDAFAATAHQFRNNHVTVPICQPGTPTLTSVLLAHMEKTGDPLLESFRKVAAAK